MYVELKLELKEEKHLKQSIVHFLNIINWQLWNEEETKEQMYKII